MLFAEAVASYVNIFVRKYNENFLFFVHPPVTLRHSKFHASHNGKRLVVKRFDFFLKFLVKIFNKNS